MFFRVHTADLAYLTQRPRGLFTAVGKLVDARVLTEEETAEYWRQRHWFEAELPIPPFYADGNVLRAITWYKDNDSGREMFDRMGFYLAMGQKYGLVLYRTSARSVPGEVIYEDAWQIGVTDSQHEGEGYECRRL